MQIKMPLCIKAEMIEEGIFELEVPYPSGDIQHINRLSFDEVLAYINNLSKTVDLSNYSLVIS